MRPCSDRRLRRQARWVRQGAVIRAFAYVDSSTETPAAKGARAFGFITQINDDRFNELISSCDQLFCADSKGSYKLFSFLPLDKISTGSGSALLTLLRVSPNERR